MADKLFEVSGVLESAHCFSIEVKAKNVKEAIKKVKYNMDDYYDSSLAELQSCTIDDINIVGSALKNNSQQELNSSEEALSNRSTITCEYELTTLSSADTQINDTNVLDANCADSKTEDLKC